MCGMCGLLQGAAHWSHAAAGSVQGRRQRLLQIARANRLLKLFRLELHDFHGQSYLLRGPTGASVLVPDFSRALGRGRAAAGPRDRSAGHALARNAGQGQRQGHGHAMTDIAFDVLPVGILTGFLGSGKTTLLRRWLRASHAGDTAVLINEFGEVGLDHLLVGSIDADTVLLDNGCVCCSIRGELKEALMRLFSRRQRGELPAFRRVVIETTGLATPGPVLATLLGDAQLRHHFRPAFVSTVVDAVHAVQQQALHPEWTAQVAAADMLWLAKTDLVSEAQALALRASLQALNPLAQQLEPLTGPTPWRDDAAHDAHERRPTTRRRGSRA
jgi:hypothetical protein